ncbi:sensor histidine kinase [Cystobacter fuscus]|uniref:sensor histidine kinase n=1 Tax=Cystobacter fuscus TaxID=43 RepID=UPI0009DE91AF|nr:HAMP domain-containing sensor histidine kinase [Cystobacter fuscus]
MGETFARCDAAPPSSSQVRWCWTASSCREDPFFRADRVRTKKGPGGVGLGLSLVRRIVEAHGGTIALAPTEDRGTRATIRLPVRNAE